jgi:hypothetical protein
MPRLTTHSRDFPSVKWRQNGASFRKAAHSCFVEVIPTLFDKVEDIFVRYGAPISDLVGYRVGLYPDVIISG